MRAPAVEIRELSKSFGAFKAVDRVSLSVNEGEIFGFLGANGAGKSTTIRMLCGLLRPTSGTGLVLGIDVARDPEGVKRRIGYMSQRFSLYNDLTVAQNVRFFGGVYGLRGEVARERQAVGARHGRARGQGGPAHRRAAGRLEAAAGPRLRRHAPAARRLPRRADERRRPHLAPALLAADRRDGGRRRDRLRHDPLPRRGGVLPPPGADPRRAPGRARHGLGAEARLRRARRARGGRAARRRGARGDLRPALGARDLGLRHARPRHGPRRSTRGGARSSGCSRRRATRPLPIERILPSLEDVFIHHVEQAQATGRETRS